MLLKETFQFKKERKPALLPDAAWKVYTSEKVRLSHYIGQIQSRLRCYDDIEILLRQESFYLLDDFDDFQPVALLMSLAPGNEIFQVHSALLEEEYKAYLNLLPPLAIVLIATSSSSARVPHSKN